MPSPSQRTLYYTHNLNPRVAVAVARHLKAPLSYVRFDPVGTDREFCRPLNPNELAPVLVEPEGSIWETDAIALRLSLLHDPDFWPAGEQVEMMRWVSWSAHHFTRAGGIFYFENIIVRRYFDRPVDDKALEEAGADFAKYARILDGILAGRDWLVGKRPTYADFRVATPLPFAAEAQLDLEGFPNILRWHARLNQLEGWRAPFDGLD